MGVVAGVVVVVLVAVGMVVAGDDVGAVGVGVVGRGGAWLAQGGDARAEGEAFKHLVEDDHGEEGEEGRVAGHDESDADHWGGQLGAVNMRQMGAYAESGR